ncbi:hypothetical protein V8359_16695 [Roseovarius sp. E0-M6]
MRDLVIIAGEWPQEAGDQATHVPKGDVRVIHAEGDMPLSDLPPGPEREIAIGVENARAKGDPPVDIVALGKPGAQLKKNWDPAHERRLFAKSVRHLLNILQTGDHRLTGLLWLAAPQGEPAGDAQRALFAFLIERLRLAIGAPDLPVCAMPVHTRATEARSSYTQNPGLKNYVRASPPRKTSPTLADFGMALARALPGAAKDSPWAATREVRWLWKGDMYQAWMSRPADAEDTHWIVVFPHLTGEGINGFEIPAFGQTAFEKRGVQTIFIRSRLSNWFQDDEVFAMGAALREALPDGARVTTYGASMGGYGALLLSDLIRAERVVAIAPQFTLDPATVPFERRWRVSRERIGRFHHDLRDHMSPPAAKFVFYDSLDKDRHHIALMQPDDTFRLIRFPGASHQILRFLQETGCLGDFLTALTDPDAGFDDLHTKARAARDRSPIYWLSVFRHFKGHNPACAAAALRLCVDIEGPKAKYTRRFAKLPPEWRTSPAVPQEVT